MQTVADIEPLRAAVAAARAAGSRIAFVPTMGNLHAGHLDLVRHAGALADFVVVSIFVNPFQFGPNEDFDSYPRTLDSDRSALSELGVNVLFIPSRESIYPYGENNSTRVEVPELSEVLCGETRPNFFRGVATVVNVLFNMVRPDLAVFGEKDYQQLLVIRRMVADLHMEIDIIARPTTREADGVAMSSRNRYLSATERKSAPALFAALCSARHALQAGDRDFEGLRDNGLAALRAAGFKPDYFTVRRADDLRAPQHDDIDLVILGAGWLGPARLIDNTRTRPDG